jgi:predicted RNase H-like HicB family nuclease
MKVREIMRPEADAGTNCAAYAPDVPGCIATGASVDEVTTTLSEAIAGHINILRDVGEENLDPIPERRLSRSLHNRLRSSR